MGVDEPVALWKDLAFFCVVLFFLLLTLEVIRV
jgi:hypothetical protein